MRLKRETSLLVFHLWDWIHVLNTDLCEFEKNATPKAAGDIPGKFFLRIAHP